MRRARTKTSGQRVWAQDLLREELGHGKGGTTKRLQARTKPSDLHFRTSSGGLGSGKTYWKVETLESKEGELQIRQIPKQKGEAPERE